MCASHSVSSGSAASAARDPPAGGRCRRRTRLHASVDASAGSGWGGGGCSLRPSPLPCITAPHPGGSSHAHPPTPGQIQGPGITECVLDAERRLEMREPRASVQERWRARSTCRRTSDPGRAPPAGVRVTGTRRLPSQGRSGAGRRGRITSGPRCRAGALGPRWTPRRLHAAHAPLPRAARGLARACAAPSGRAWARSRAFLPAQSFRQDRRKRACAASLCPQALHGANCVPFHFGTAGAGSVHGTRRFSPPRADAHS